ncbi:MAG: polysaccharide deacetylase family protein [Oscillospiraceae bacterium]|nr:polysaccharide deacetylase family protein [Oscillospiraceae bacterium]
MKKLYPNGKNKVFNITYDDGVLQDIRFVSLLNRFGLKGTFNLNSQLMEEEFAWIHPCGMEVKRLGTGAVQGLYDGHEIASHTLTHPYMHDLPEFEILRQLGEDRACLESHFGREVKGFAVPFDYYSDLIARSAEICGFEYARMSQTSLSYVPCTDWYHWKTGVYHIMPELVPFVEGFLETDQELAVCQIVGHSYDLDAENLWETMEGICAKVAAQNDVWFCTNLELVRYLKAMAQFDGTNRSDTNLWFEQDGAVIMLRPGVSMES